ncbi:MAG: SpoIIE family protein phosphatase [Thiohalocapsa sp.]|nr:SpoIIE family protein phosphatase [Thiohalocapsa sp.]MCF7991032.1 SpoIIE family protein phosphatase [Thiohalocapsa sp.]
MPEPDRTRDDAPNSGRVQRASMLTQTLQVLVIDDAPDVRIYVRALLRKWGYEAVLASNGAEGLERMRQGGIRLVICDWMMDGMSGPEVCAAIRREDFGHYVYVMLLTGRTEDTDLVYGLDSGADDFVGKPFDAQVLRARLQVGVRILGLEETLAEQNRRLQEHHDELDRAYTQIQNDLAAAARIQRESLPVSDDSIAPLCAGWLFLPAAKISGDSFHFFPVSQEEVGFYHLDVSGHGIPAALLSTSLSRSLVPHTGVGTPAGDYLVPADFLTTLNHELCSPDGEVTNYATVVYGVLDKYTGEGRLASAGHPQPMLLRSDGSVESLTAGGLPVGMFEAAQYEAQRFRLYPGDRLITYSDGITDCFNADGQAFDIDHFQSLLVRHRHCTAAEMAEELRRSVTAWRGETEFEDDISVLVIERQAD